MGLAHPYTPSALHLKNYVENDKTKLVILSILFGILLMCLVTVYFAVSLYRYKRGHFFKKLKMCWFFSSGIIHTLLEGYYFSNYRSLASNNSFLAQTWKEYSICDSRYITGDPFVVCMEGVTAFIVGPLAFYSFYAFMHRRPERHVIQLSVSLCQLYGDILYFATEYLENFKHGPYGDPIYFWFYFIFLNLLWIIIPFLCILESFKVLSRLSMVYELNIYSKDNKTQ